MTAPKITFVNHASVHIRTDNVGLLSDPWYSGDAFHHGWNLLSEPDPVKIKELLADTTHLWLSHEHPDHFSIKFFKEYKDVLLDNNIKIIFQHTEDKRVMNFLSANGLDVTELDFGKKVELAPDFSVTCIKDGFYDSGLCIEASGQTILNLNDCDITTVERASEVFDVVGVCDVLLTQFSYAAWKGGKENKAWRELAAREKLNSVAIQVDTFKPKIVIPFASFVYFSNERNFYLNDAVNRPTSVVEKLQHANVKVNVMQPFDVFDGTYDEASCKKAIVFWEDHLKNIPLKPKSKYTKIAMSILETSFSIYQKRVFSNNSRSFMRLIKKVIPMKVFTPITIHLDDIGKTVVVDLFNSELAETTAKADLVMASESLHFLFTNAFGFDTLTVNGCFEEQQEGGFAKAAKSLAIENLNNLGIQFRPSILVNIKLIWMFLGKLKNVTKKIKMRG